MDDQPNSNTEIDQVSFDLFAGKVLLDEIDQVFFDLFAGQLLFEMGHVPKALEKLKKGLIKVQQQVSPAVIKSMIGQEKMVVRLENIVEVCSQTESPFSIRDAHGDILIGLGFPQLPEPPIEASVEDLDNFLDHSPDWFIVPTDGVTISWTGTINGNNILISPSIDWQSDHDVSVSTIVHRAVQSFALMPLLKLESVRISLGE